MRLDIRAFTCAGGLVAALLFVVCSVGVALAPQAAATFAGDLIHADLTGLVRTLTWGSFALGLVVWTAGTALTFAVIAATYNRLAATAPVGR